MRNITIPSGAMSPAKHQCLTVKPKDYIRLIFYLLLVAIKSFSCQASLHQKRTS